MAEWAVDRDELIRLGLLDPEHPRADQRRELLEDYLERGFTVDQMVAAAERGRLLTLPGDLAVRASRDRLTTPELAERCGLTVDQVEAALRASGLPHIPRDLPYFGDDDLTLVQNLRLASDVFGMDDVLHFVRSMGMAASRLASAAIHLANATVMGPLEAAGGTELETSRQNEATVATLDAIPQALETLFRHHVERELLRSVHTEKDLSGRTASMAVAFLDLVGFTSASAGLTTGELVDAIGAFESLAVDVVASHDARLVKVIGDEVMFVSYDADVACEIAAAIRAEVDVRGGITYGQVLTLEGDCYGTGVNLAARAVAAAEPGQVLVDRGVVDAAPGHRFDPAGERVLKGFAEPVALFALTP